MNNNKICLVSGSTLGIGLAIAEKLGKDGYTVIISSRREENSRRAEEILKENLIAYEYYMCNFNIRNQRKELVRYISEKYGKLDCLVCTINSNPYIGDSLEINEKEFDVIFKLNVKETFFTIIDFLALLKNGRDPNILLISSHSGYIPFPYVGISSIAKTALYTMTKVFAEEFSKFKIRINCLAPGLIKASITNLNIQNIFSQMNLFKRLGTPNEIANTASFLCSKEGSFITGEVISVNGGMVGRL